jgi:hypothetical protein
MFSIQDKNFPRIFFWSFFVIVCAEIVFIFVFSKISFQNFEKNAHNEIVSSGLIGLEEKEIVKKSILYLGDIMLDRGVEYLMEKNGPGYIFEKIKSITENNDFVCGNLEGPIVNNPKNFPSKSIQFAFAPETANLLSSACFLWQIIILLIWAHLGWKKPENYYPNLIFHP